MDLLEGICLSRGSLILRAEQKRRESIMIQQVGRIMLYVDNQEEAKNFWTQQVGFSVVDDQTENGIRWIEIVPSKDAQTSFILHDKKIISKLEPELTLTTPSLMFYTPNVEELYETFKQKGITVGEMVTTSSGKGFNFADSENNYFVVVEKN